MKKCVFLTVPIFAASLMFGACKGLDPNAVTIMGRESDLSKTYMTRIFDRYKEVTGNNLNIISYEDSEFETSALKAFSKGNAPDILLHFHNSDLSRFDPNDFYDLSGEEWVSDLTESALEYSTNAEGTLLGLPFWESSVSGCYYNKTLIEGLGLNVPCTSQSNFNSLCAALKTAGRTPICWPANCAWMFQFALDPVFADDPELLERLNGNETSYSEIGAVTDAVEWIASAYSRGWFGSDSLDTGWNEISGKLNSGEAAMIFIWDTWFYTDFEEGRYTKDDFALMPVFMNTAPGGTYEGGNLNMMMVNKDSDKLEKTLEFLRFCATPEHYNEAFSGIPTVSVFKGQTTNIQSKMVTEAAESIRLRERVSTASTKIRGYSQDDMAEAIRRLFRGKTTAAECVREMEASRLRESAADRD